ncbi:MAG TPA: cupin domain-containing protein [Sphingomicrobium sp.]|jgi:mannose-6-phosphate isomerase-like protein (cupin superfamily)|nr:cupin domain-containing protein [Sphingomicrobium sp.]
MPATIVRAGERAPLDILGMPMTMLCEARETGGCWSLFEEQVPLGMGPPPHRHDWDEAYYVLEGIVDFVVDGETIRSNPGDFNYLPRGTVHSFKGASDAPAKVLIFAAPAHGSEFFQELSSEVRILPGDASKIPEIGERHGIHFITAKEPAS